MPQDWFAQNAPKTNPEQQAGDDWFASNAPRATQEPQAQAAQPAADRPGFGKRLAESVGIPTSMDEVKQMGESFKDTAHSPWALLGPAAPIVRGYVGQVGEALKQGKEEFKDAVDVYASGNKGEAAVRGFGTGAMTGLRMVPFIGPSIETAGDDVSRGNYKGAAGGFTGVAAQVAALRGSPKPQGAPMRGAMAKRMAEIPPGEQFTRGEVLDAARRNRVNLDLADATDSKIARGVKKVNQYSVAGQGSYEANATRNLEALSKWADRETGRYAKESTPREVLGGQTQQALQQDLQLRKSDASIAYENLDKSIGSKPINATRSVQAEAQRIISENKAYYDKHPELKPSKAWGILEDLARRPIEKAAQGPSGLVDAYGKQVPGSPARFAETKTMSWSELHQLRSDLMDFYRNNPDIVKGRGEAWIQRMVASIDNAMTDASAGLSPGQLAEFRHANQLWESIKTTYDNPQSPYFHAVRSATPSQVPAMLSKATPELARQVRNTLGNLEGPFQRQFVENLLNGKDGSLDLRNLNSRLSRVPDDFLVSMLGKKGAQNLRLLGKVAQKVTYDSNPSGTAKHVTATGEVVNLFANPVAGAAELGASYGTAKAMNSPRVVDYLTRKPKRGPARHAKRVPIGVLAGVANSEKR
jgi:hypothetical protein